LSGTGGDELLGGVPDPTLQLADLVVQLRLTNLPATHGLESGIEAALDSAAVATLLRLVPASIGLCGQEKANRTLDRSFVFSTPIPLRSPSVGTAETFGLWVLASVGWLKTFLD